MSSSGCMKGCLGCGCVSVVLAGLLALGIGGYLWWQGPELMDGLEESFSIVGQAGGGEGGGLDITRLGETAGGGEGGARSVEQLLQGEGGSATGAAQGQQLRTADQFFDTLDRPMTSRDLATVKSGMEEWENSRTIQRFHGLLEEGEKLADDDSLMGNARKVRVAVGLAFRFRDIVREYPEHVKAHGGDDYQMAYAQLAMIHRMSQVAAGNTEHDSWEQAVADSLLADHDENREAFEQSRAKIQEYADGGETLDLDSLPEEERAELMETLANQFTHMTSAVNRESLESWASLSDDERKAIAEKMDTPTAIITRLVSHATDESGVMAFHMWAL